MALIAGLLTDDADLRRITTVSMARALSVNRSQPIAQWTRSGFSLAAVGDPGDTVAHTSDGPYDLWLAGELFRTPWGEARNANLIEPSRLLALLRTLASGRFDVLRDVDGEFQAVLWNEAERRVTVVNDRFGSLPTYWAVTGRATVFASGVRALMMVDGVPATPDADAIREAVSFGGFRLGDRTNIAAARMLPPASVFIADPSPHLRSYWSFAEITPTQATQSDDVVERLGSLWREAIANRLAGAVRPGQTLSGGLDSRAILAEGASQAPRWTAITYGMPGCDDARFAQRAAAAAGVTWVFQPLFSGHDGQWVERRAEFIQLTDGLIELVDLMHCEALDLQRATIDVHLSGFIGDVIAGSTYDVSGADGLLRALPYYGGPLAYSYPEALARAEALVRAAASARAAVLSHKIPQSTNRLTAAWRPWLKVRRPFTDYRLVDFCLGLPDALRGSPSRVYEHFLLRKYPMLFARIPNHKTGAPVCASGVRLRWCQARRVSRRAAYRVLSPLGLPIGPVLRDYHADSTYWRQPDAWHAIETVVLRPESVVCEIFGRRRVEDVLRAWRERLAGAVQVIGALYVFERYHRDLPSVLTAARRVENCVAAAL